MSKTMIIMKREFLEFVQTKTFLIGTLLGPLLIVGFIGLEVLILTRVGGGEYKVAIIDQTDNMLGQQVAQVLPEISRSAPMGKPSVFHATVINRPANLQQVRDSLDARVALDSLGGYLIIPAGVLKGAVAHYYGKNATTESVTDNLKNALQRSVQSTRLAAQGFDPSKVGAALAPVRLEAEKTGGRGMRGSAVAGQIIGFLMGFAIYLVIALYGAAIMNGVLEEKRDKIVEVIVSSARARDLMIGKVLGIGGAGFLQLLVWVVCAGLVIAYAGSIATLFHMSPEKAAVLTGIARAMPKVPLSVGVIFLVFFMGGFFIYSTVYATIGSIVTTNQEAQQLVFPAIMPLIIGFLMANTALQNPDAGMAVAGSLIPFTSPMVMPIRAVVGSASNLEILLSIVLLVVTGLAMLWLAGKIYRIGIFATGKRPTMKEVGRWIRAA